MNLERAEQIGTVMAGTEYYEDFLIDNVLAFHDGTEELHYHIYIPDSYDGTKPYALYITLPGYGAYYFQGVAVNLKMEHFATEAKKYNDEMIIVAPQPNDWGNASKRQTIELTKYMLAAYNINQESVYISGYSGGGETLSLAVSEHPRLYTAALHVSSRWDGNFSRVAEEKRQFTLPLARVMNTTVPNPQRRHMRSLSPCMSRQGWIKKRFSLLLFLT